MADTTAYYDRTTRHILGKLEVFFDGYENEPTVIDISDYLIDFQVVEEASAEDKNPLGAISANELTCTLTNFKSRFSPSNPDGPYYGKIKVGVPIKPYIKPADEEVTQWEQLGVFYVSDWSAKMGSSTAFITCYDTVQDLLLTPIPNLDIQISVTYANYFKYVLGMYGYTTAQIDATLNDILPYGYAAYTETKEMLQALVEASMSVLMSDRHGVVNVKRLKKSTPVAVLTDSNQLIAADTEQSIIKTYNGVRLTYVLPQLSEDRKVLVVDNLAIPAGTTTHNLIKYEKPVFNISGASIIGEKPCVLDKYVSTAIGITLVTMLDDANSTSAKLTVTGKNIDLIKQELSDDLTNMLDVYNPYVQLSNHAEEYKNNLTNFVKADVPILELVIRGNPNIHIGDTVKVQSNKYNIDFVGIVKRNVIKYSGHLSCEMTLLNAEVIE